MTQWRPGRVDTEEIYPLATLLQLRLQEERQARQALAQASTQHAQAMERLGHAESHANQHDEQLTTFQIEASGRRASGYTIKQRREDAQDEQALLHSLRQAEQARDACVKQVQSFHHQMQSHQTDWEHARQALKAARRHHEQWRARQDKLAQTREEEERSHHLHTRSLSLLEE